MPPKKPAKKTEPHVDAAQKPATHVEKKPAKPKGVPAKRSPQPAKTELRASAETGETAGERYWEAVGRRKSAVARVRLFTKGEKGLSVNGKNLADYFQYSNFGQIASEALETMKSEDRFRASAKVSGGGSRAQSEAIRHATARALVLFNPDFRKRLKKAGFLTRDSRAKERKKFGLKGARRAPQWAKR